MPRKRGVHFEATRITNQAISAILSCDLCSYKQSQKESL